MRKSNQKKMIAKFAIMTNNYVGYVLKAYYPLNHIIFRNCNFENNKNIENIDTFAIFIEYIMNNAVTANYSNTNSNHDLLKVDEYLHMTSPLRRASDCIIHYLLKHSFLNYAGAPFSENEIKKMIEQSNVVNKSLKKLQFRDMKFRMLQTMEETLHLNISKSFTIEFYIFSHLKPYLNIVIHKIDNDSSYLSLTLKRPKIEYVDENLINKKLSCTITKINCCNYYDEGSLPELDTVIDSLFL